MTSVLELLLLLLFLFSFLSLSSFVFSLNQEGLYLQSFKLDLDDPNGALSDWSTQDPNPCNWNGVTCDPRTHSVTSLNVSGASLAGPFPVVLCRMPSLSSLVLYDNNFNSSLPSLISTCRNLTVLDLSQNLFVGPIPSSLSEMEKLRVLNLDGNSFSGDIPVSFGLFRQLEKLILTNNCLNGSIPSALGNITSLKELRLAYNPFAPSQLSPELGNLTNLDYFWLAGCNLVGTIPDTFAQLSRLSNLDVAENRLRGPIPKVVFQLKSIVQIELFNNSFSGPIPERGWSNLTKLRRFDASMNNLVGSIPEELCQLALGSLNLYLNQLVGHIPESIAKSPNLYELKLFANHLVGSLPSQLGMNSRLQTLDVTSNNLSGEIPVNLCKNGALEELVLVGNGFSGNIPASLSKCRTLSRVRLPNNRFSGDVPAEFWGLPNVYLLDLADNLLSGNISGMISGAKNLSKLAISKNQFSGALPDEIGSLKTLVEISANDNQFTGQIPGTIVNLGQLGTLDLSNNKLSGIIPGEIQLLKQLNELNLANNQLSGEIPDRIGNLPGLNYLDLSGNQLSGRIPVGLQNLKLNMLNLSNNHFTGDIPALYAKGFYRDSFLGNPGLCVDLVGICTQKGGKNQGYLWILLCIFTAAGLVFVVGVAWFMWKYQDYKKSKKGIIVISKWRSFHKLDFSEFEILDTLDEDNVIGSGASGKVYKAVLSNGEVVAVKKLLERSKKDVTSFDINDSEKDEFEAEVETLGKIRHKNIVRLWCCCNAGDCRLLVYEYMPNGSLADLLHSSKGKTLDWPTRLRIALDAAEGLSYLHHDCVPPIVHRDVKSNNILLDKDFGARIADFGVAKIFQAAKGGESMSIIAGSCGYIAPEYAYTLRVNEKSDIYSFGVVILELVTGRLPTDPEFGEKDLVKWVTTTLDQKGVEQVIDPNLDSVFKEQICRVLGVGLCCISPLPINRPSMRKVVKLLQEARDGDKPKTRKDGKLSPYYHEEFSDQASQS